jgi:hypothetical protein
MNPSHWQRCGIPRQAAEARWPYLRDVWVKLAPVVRKYIKVGISQLKHKIAGICGQNDEGF